MVNGHRRWLLSGGIGSGKSVVRGTLKRVGWHVVDADSVGHRVLGRDGPAFREVATAWPDVIVRGQVDRSALARVVFADPDELQRLERITHPYIFGRIKAEVQGIDQPVAVEVPLLVNPFNWLRMIVDSVEEVKLDRLRSRGMSAESARARMAAQPTRSEWLAAADLVIPNHGSLEELVSTVLALAPKL